MPKEAEAVRELCYAAGSTTLSQLAVWMNSRGFRTRNMHRLPSGNDCQAVGPKLFATASVRGILHNPFYSGKIKHRDQLLLGSHQALFKEDGQYLGTYFGCGATLAQMEVKENATLRGALYGDDVKVKENATVIGMPSLEAYLAFFGL